MAYIDTKNTLFVNYLKVEASLSWEKGLVEVEQDWEGMNTVTGHGMFG